MVFGITSTYAINAYSITKIVSSIHTLREMYLMQLYM